VLQISPTNRLINKFSNYFKELLVAAALAEVVGEVDKIMSELKMSVSVDMKQNLLSKTVICIKNSGGGAFRLVRLEPYLN
jgi:5-enolpyruvylshikimate-3-phosphate synthase